MIITNRFSTACFPNALQSDQAARAYPSFPCHPARVLCGPPAAAWKGNRFPSDLQPETNLCLSFLRLPRGLLVLLLVQLHRAAAVFCLHKRWALQWIRGRRMVSISASWAVCLAGKQCSVIAWLESWDMWSECSGGGCLFVIGSWLKFWGAKTHVIQFWRCLRLLGLVKNVFRATGRLAALNKRVLFFNRCIQGRREGAEATTECSKGTNGFRYSWSQILPVLRLSKMPTSLLPVVDQM